MKERKFNYIEKMAIYFAENSVGKSVPVFCHKVERPQNIERMITEIYKNDKE